MTAAELVHPSLKCFDTLEKIFGWAFFVIIVVCWSAIRNSQEIEVAKLTIPRHQAFWVVGLIYLVVSCQIVILLTRLNDMVSQVDANDATLPELVIGLTTHSWTLNPIFYCGTPPSYVDRFAFAMLPLIWWFGVASLVLLFDGPAFWVRELRLIRTRRTDRSAVGQAVVLCCLSAFGVWMLALIVDIYSSIIAKCNDTLTAGRGMGTLRHGLADLMPIWDTSVKWGTTVGVLGCAAILIWRSTERPPRFFHA